MGERLEVSSQVALAALLDTECLEHARTRSGPFGGGELSAELLAGGAVELVAGHPTVTRLVAAAMIDPAPRLRATVAARPDLDSTCYPVLATDVDDGVRQRVAANPSAPVAVLDRLTLDPVSAVREAAVGELVRRRAFPTAHAS
jgi:hypothetical protein